MTRIVAALGWCAYTLGLVAFVLVVAVVVGAVG